jgi:hypothetical protein
VSSAGGHVELRQITHANKVPLAQKTRICALDCLCGHDRKTEHIGGSGAFTSAGFGPLRDQVAASG